MKILVLQLARLGDIYLSWPALRALRRAHPTAEIVLLTRTSFSHAAEGLTAINEAIEIPIKDILAPLIQDSMDIMGCHGRLTEFVAHLKQRNFDRVINLSFSPVSSYLTHLVMPDSTKVTGYTRTEDGFLAIPDDMSAYFYAQVGPGQSNRFHLAEIFSTLCGSDLATDDWKNPELKKIQSPVSGDFIAVHVGASEVHKTITAEKWIAILSQFRTVSSTPVVLIGSAGEKDIAEKILASTPTGSVVSRVGDLTLTETMSLIQQAKILVGPDSAPLHMASLTQTKTLNLSVGQVNFWETGPRAPGSWVLRAGHEADLASDRVARVMSALLKGERAETGVIQALTPTHSYQGLFPKESEFQWNLVRAIYQGTPFPQPLAKHHWEALVQLAEMNEFLIAQLQDLKNGASLHDRNSLIERGEEVISVIGKILPSWSPLIRWYQTEKVRIGPGTDAEVLNRTLEIQNLLQQVLEVYADMQEVANATIESEAP